jgi:hypothetical protein
MKNVTQKIKKVKTYGMKDAFKGDFIYKHSWKVSKNMPKAFSTTK